MSIRANKPAESADATAMLNQVAGDLELAEGNNYCVASPDKPLKRQLVVSIRASLNDLCLQKQKGTWAPSSDALKSIFQQKKFTSLDVSCCPQKRCKLLLITVFFGRARRIPRATSRCANLHAPPRRCRNSLPPVLRSRWSSTTSRSTRSPPPSPSRWAPRSLASTTRPSPPPARPTP